ncbi:hypothetical protein [Deferrisoma sp.]
MKRVAAVVWVALGVMVFVFAVGGCSKPGPAPDGAFLERPLVVADPGWNRGNPVEMGVTVGAFAQGVGGEPHWEQGPDGTWALAGTSEGNTVRYLFRPEGDRAVLSEVKQGSKAFTKREIWAVAQGVAKKVGAAETGGK